MERWHQAVGIVGVGMLVGMRLGSSRAGALPDFVEVTLPWLVELEMGLRRERRARAAALEAQRENLRTQAMARVLR